MTWARHAVVTGPTRWAGDATVGALTLFPPERIVQLRHFEGHDVGKPDFTTAWRRADPKIDAGGRGRGRTGDDAAAYGGAAANLHPVRPDFALLASAHDPVAHGGAGAQGDGAAGRGVRGWWRKDGVCSRWPVAGLRGASRTGYFLSYPREGGGPSSQHGTWAMVERWVPASAGMTKRGKRNDDFRGRIIAKRLTFLPSCQRRLASQAMVRNDETWRAAATPTS